jgi:hypothetical protein
VTTPAAEAPSAAAGTGAAAGVAPVRIARGFAWIAAAALAAVIYAGVLGPGVRVAW